MKLFISTVIILLAVPFLVSYLLFRPDSALNIFLRSSEILPPRSYNTSPDTPLVTFSPNSDERGEYGQERGGSDRFSLEIVKNIQAQLQKSFSNQDGLPVFDGVGGIGTTPQVHIQNNLPLSSLIPVLSEEEIFNKVWPKYYRDSLYFIQEQMLATNFLRQKDTFTFDSPSEEENIYKFNARSLEWAVSVGLVKPEDEPNLRRGLENLRRLVAKEKASLRDTGRIGIYFPHYRLGQFTQVPFMNLVTLVRNFVAVQIARAQEWISAPSGLCYKAYAPPPPGNPVPGPNLWSFCCNCGIREVVLGVIFMPECTLYPNGSAVNGVCDVAPLGCLNLVCLQFPNGVWDGPPGAPPPAPPYTGICGCGL